jgi:hypothetical protein
MSTESAGCGTCLLPARSWVKPAFAPAAILLFLLSGPGFLWTALLLAFLALLWVWRGNVCAALQDPRWHEIWPDRAAR